MKFLITVLFLLGIVISFLVTTLMSRGSNTNESYIYSHKGQYVIITKGPYIDCVGQFQYYGADVPKKYSNGNPHTIKLSYVVCPSGTFDILWTTEESSTTYTK